MSTIKNRRVVIASLFLPNTALLGAEDVEATPDLPPIPSPGVHNGAPVLSMPKPMTHARKISGPLPSILDDLAGKVCMLVIIGPPLLQIHMPRLK